MITINLLPEEFKKKIKKRSSSIGLPKIPFLPILLGVCGVFIGFYLLLLIFLFIENRSLALLNNDYEKIAKDKKEVSAVKDEIKNISNKILVLDKLIKEESPWSRRLNDLSGSMVSGVWLRKIYLGEKIIQVKSDPKEAVKDKLKKEEPKKVKYLGINGSVIAKGSEEAAIVGRFINSLKSNTDFFKDFKDVELGVMQSSMQDEVEIVNFELFCYFK